MEWRRVPITKPARSIEQFTRRTVETEVMKLNSAICSYAHTSTLCVVLVLLLAGCGARREYVVSRFDVTHKAGWDTLRVQAAFAQRTVLGGDELLQPEVATVSVFSSTYDTLFTTTLALHPDSILLLPVPDRMLGDRAPILVEICGTFGRFSICEQGGMKASPKRLALRHDLTYPENSDVDRGRYDFQFTVERQRYGLTRWEPLGPPPHDVQGYLLAYVANERKDAVRVPLNGPRGAFNLARHDGYQDFSYQLKSKMHDAQEADVRFEVFAGLDAAPTRLAAIKKQVRAKTDEEREDEVFYFAEGAAAQVVDSLSGFLGAGDALAFIDGWEFNPLMKKYRIEMEVVWRGGFFDRDRYELEGMLIVREDGSEPRFQAFGGNEDARRRWESKIEGKELRLKDLGRPPEKVEEVAEEEGDDMAVN